LGFLAFVLVIFEDVHWIDPTSLELLILTVERRDVPVLLLSTARPEFTPPWPAHAHVTTLPLSRLDRPDTATIVENIAGNHALPPDIVREIAERTDGVPLFVEELTKAVLESGAQGTAALSAVPAVSHPALSVPATLHASLMARLDRLGLAAKDIAQKGAVIGREFAYELLALIADRPEAELREVLDRLTSSGLLFARGTPPESMYTFKHALVQDAVYDTLLRSRRQEWHARIATVLESRFPEVAEQQPDLVAQHCTQAGLIERAVLHWDKAGRKSALRSAMTEAAAQVRRGLELLATLHDHYRERGASLLLTAFAVAYGGEEGIANHYISQIAAQAATPEFQGNRISKALTVALGWWTGRESILPGGAVGATGGGWGGRL
jgi:predicted ATPase